MKIVLSDEQYAELRKDHYLEIIINADTEQDLYFKFNDSGAFKYGEIIQKHIPGYPSKFYFDGDDLEKIIPTKPRYSSWLYDKPVCPSCAADMLYHFEHCPKCGQAMDWRE